MELTAVQLKWLKTQGGRTTVDVHEDKDGLFILMYEPRSMIRTEKVYLPLKYYYPKRKKKIPKDKNILP